VTGSAGHEAGCAGLSGACRRSAGGVYERHRGAVTCGANVNVDVSAVGPFRSLYAPDGGLVPVDRRKLVVSPRRELPALSGHRTNRY